MNLTLKVLNEDATLNSWTDLGGSVQVVRGADAKLIVQLFQSDRKIRYVPISGAVITTSLLKNDGTLLSKTATVPFSDDRSIAQFSLSAAETAVLIGQNLVVKVVEGAVTTYALLQLGLQMVAPTQEGC